MSAPHPRHAHQSTPRCSSELCHLPSGHAATTTAAAADHHGHDHGHDDEHGHSHGLGHTHDHSGSAPWRLMVALGLTSTVFIAEVIGAIWTGSLALLTDAGHMLTDMVGLTVALGASLLMQKAASRRRTWGFLRIEVLAAGAQALILSAVGIFALIEGIRRLITPEEIHGTAVLIFGIVGLLANIGSLIVLTSARSTNLNMRAAFLEVLNDALGSVAVIVAAIIIATTGFTRADAIAGMIIALLILPRAFVILRESWGVLMEQTPPQLDVDKVSEHLLSQDDVLAVHDLHAWRISTTLPVLTAHVVVDTRHFEDGRVPQLLAELQHCLTEHFAISHATLQVEPPNHEEASCIVDQSLVDAHGHTH